MRRVRLIVSTLLIVWIPACGDDTPKPAVRDTPEAHLAWIRDAAEAADQAALDERLLAWPTDDPEFTDADETQIALTWRLRRAVDRGDFERASGDATLLLDRFDGGQTPEGRDLPPGMLRMGLVEAAADAAAAAVEGPHPTPERADVLVRLAIEWLPEPKDAHELARLRQLGLWTRWREFPNGALAEHDGPRVVVFTDHFAIGEPILPSVLERWQRDLGPQGLRVSLVPTPSGSVRVGIRRAPAPRREEVSAVRQVGEDLGVFLEQPRDEIPGAVMTPIGDRRVAIFVVDRKGLIVARKTGVATLDPRDLEEPVQRVSTR